MVILHNDNKHSTFLSRNLDPNPSICCGENASYYTYHYVHHYQITLQILIVNI